MWHIWLQFVLRLTNNLNTINENKHDSKRYVITRTFVRLFLSLTLCHTPPILLFIHCLHNTVKTLFVIAYRYTLIPFTSHRELISSLSFDILDVINFIFILFLYTIVEQFRFLRKRKHAFNKLFINQSTHSRLFKHVYRQHFSVVWRDTQIYLITWH